MGHRISFIFHTQINRNSKKCFILLTSIFFSIPAKVFAQKFLKRTCTGSNPATLLNSVAEHPGSSQRKLIHFRFYKTINRRNVR